MASGKNATKKKTTSKGKTESHDVMLSPKYMEKSLNLIQEALRCGSDVLQLENGDIVTTGTKTVITTYRWDKKTGEMTRISSEEASETPFPIPIVTGARRKRKKK
jgi:hypothetical protein